MKQYTLKIWIVPLLTNFYKPAKNTPLKELISMDKDKYRRILNVMIVRCGVCARTKAMLGNSFQYINEIECHPQGPNAQTELCVAKQLQGTPTWTIEQNGAEIKRHTGFLTAEELAEFAGCSI